MQKSKEKRSSQPKEFLSLDSHEGCILYPKLKYVNNKQDGQTLDINSRSNKETDASQKER